MKFQDLCCKKLLGKSALLQNKRLVQRWIFANVLMCVGKKSAGKKNKFCVGEVRLVFVDILIFYFGSMLCFSHSIQLKKYWRSAGFRRTKSSRKTKRSECFFDYANLQKFAELKSMSGLFFYFSILHFPPHFANTMLN